MPKFISFGNNVVTRFKLLHCQMRLQNMAHPTNPVEGCADANPKTMLPNDT